MKTILITQRVDIFESYNERRDALDQRWTNLLEAFNCLIVPVPNNIKNLKKFLENMKIDGIVLTGGNTPVLYGGNAPERDETDQELLEYAVKNRVPLVGVCRGMQSIVCYFGGTLSRIEKHVAVRHNLQGQICREVNSYHGFCVDRAPSTLETLATAPDCTIEAVKHIEYPIVGFMWHPERESPYQQEDKELIMYHLGLEK